MFAESLTYFPWFSFNLAIIGILFLDLGVFRKKTQIPTYKESLFWSLGWLILAVLFGLWILKTRGHEAAIAFFTGYAVEKSLSLDNIMIFVLIFEGLHIPQQYQHKVLFWGVFGALILRIIMILSGVVLLQKFHFLIYIFGGFLLVTGLQMLRHQNDNQDIKQGKLWKFIQKHLPLNEQFNTHYFLVKVKGSRKATPLLASLLLIEASDVIFALDSIPAIFAITLDPFIIYTSNVFAILGLRSLYFLLARAISSFVYLKKGLACILCFVGLKMLGVINISSACSLGIIISALFVSIYCSLPKRKA
jgi:tellurite resistance protein TerC